VASILDALLLDLLEWIGPAARPYLDVMEAWQTSCPSLAIWEEANARGYVQRRNVAGQGPVVALSASGCQHLRRHRLPVSES
jgi:D-3-phosphoglycerate dehydrogenase